MYINHFIYNNNDKALVSKFSGFAMDPQQDLSRSITYILIHYCILSKIIVSIISLINMSFLNTFTNVIFWSSSTLFFPLSWINSIFLTCELIALLYPWTNHFKRLALIISSIGITPIFELRISPFRILSFHLFPLSPS